MNVNEPGEAKSEGKEASEPREPAATERAQLGDDEQVEVLVEDLFIEEYPQAIVRIDTGARGLAQAHPQPRGRFKRIALGLIAIGAMAIASVFFGKRGKGTSRVLRKLRRFAH